jgi:signal recognition particle subunit SRP68
MHTPTWQHTLHVMLDPNGQASAPTVPWQVRQQLCHPLLHTHRHLHIPLLSAERAWAHAMELKKETEDRVDSRKRHHSIRRFAKAAFWAAELACFAAATADTRSALEADAYSSWMTGNLLLEKESDWHKALGAYLRAK